VVQVTGRRALAVAVPAAITLALAARLAYLAREIQDIPDELAELGALLQASGWTPYARHPLLCRETGPHVHIASPGGYATMVLLTDGKIRFR
jgi:hypothetical protein